jgi:hypothetical protein
MKIVKFTGFILSTLCIFIIPLWYLIDKYSKVKVVEATTKTVMPIPILLFLILIVLVGIIGLAVWLFAMWLQSATKSKVSFAFIAPFGLVILALTWVFRMLVSKVILLIETNVTQFIEDLNGYMYSLGVVMIWVLIGLGIGIISALANTVYEYKKRTTI